jgi:hypothetical protein
LDLLRSRTRVGMLLLFVNTIEAAIDLPRHISFETPNDLLLGQSLLGPPLHVVPRPEVATHPDQDDPPQRVVGDPVPASVQPMPVGLAGGGRKRRYPAQPCEGLKRLLHKP